MKKFTRISAVLAVGALLGSLAACSPPEAAQPEAAQDLGDTGVDACTITAIGYSPPSLQTEFFQNFGAALEAAASAEGITYLSDDPGQDAAKQVSGIENLITAGVQSIAITAQDPNSLSSSVSLAADNDVSLVGLFGDFPGADVAVGPDDAQLGAVIGEQAGKSLLALKPDQESYNVVILNNDSLGEAVITRGTSMEAAFAELIPNYTVVANVEALTEQEGNDAMNTILQSTREIDVVLSTNDSSSLGAISALQAAGFSPGADVVVAISGSTERALQSIIDGLTPGGPYADLAVWAEATLNAMKKSACGEPILDEDRALSLSTVDASNARELYDELYK